MTPIDKVLQQLERQEGEIGENELVLALTESAQLNGEKPDPLEIKVLATSLMAGEKKLSRDKLRKIMYKSEEEIASAIRESEDVFTPYHSLRIGNLSSITSDEDLVKFFKSRGYNIEDASVMYDKGNAHSKRVGYLNFGTKEEADRCLAEMNKCKIDDKAIILGETEDDEMARGARVKTSNLPMDFDQRRLRALFKHYGNIKSCKLEKDHDGTSRGIGHIQFEDLASAECAVAELDGISVGEGDAKQKIKVNIHSYLQKAKAKIDFKRLVMLTRERMKKASSLAPKASERVRPELLEVSKRPFLKSYDRTPASFGFTSKLV